MGTRPTALNAIYTFRLLERTMQGQQTGDSVKIMKWPDDAMRCDAIIEVLVSISHLGKRCIRSSRRVEDRTVKIEASKGEGPYIGLFFSLPPWLLSCVLQGA